jgi:hypothetical protein
MDDLSLEELQAALLTVQEKKSTVEYRATLRLTLFDLKVQQILQNIYPHGLIDINPC